VNTRAFQFLLALSLAFGCARHDAPTPHTTQSDRAAAKREEQPSRAVPAPAPQPKAASIYDLAVHLSDDTGAVRALEDFRGHPVLITMFYGSCASACPLLTSDLKRIEKELPERARAKLRVLMVSFDAARDTPAVLGRLKKERSMDPARWTLASAPDDEARELAGVLGIRYRKLDNGEFFHSSVIVLLDEEGRPAVRLEGLGSDASPILAALTSST
jgi:protein SCO1/2